MTITVIREWLRDYWVVLLVGLGVAGYFGWQWVTPPRADLTVTTSSQSLTASASTSSSHAQAGYVYIQGAVAHPGLYPVTGQTRWDAVVQAAGGVTKQADTSGLNLRKLPTMRRVCTSRPKAKHPRRPQPPVPPPRDQ